MFHANSWGIAFGAPMVGARLVLPGPALDGPSVHAMLTTHKVTHTAGVPTVWLGLMDHMTRTGARIPTLSTMIVGGAACPRVVFEFFGGKHGVDVRHLWGMTEISPCGTVGGMKGSLMDAGLDAESMMAMRLKQGRPHVFMDMRIVGEDGGELPHNGKAFGNLQVRGPIAVKKYYRSDAPGADAEGWFDTGDVATLDEYGYMQVRRCAVEQPTIIPRCMKLVAEKYVAEALHVTKMGNMVFNADKSAPFVMKIKRSFCELNSLAASASCLQITDRSKDVIKSGGEWISSIEIENLAVGHPGVAEAAVIGIPDPKWSERPLLVVVRADGSKVTKQEVLSFLEGKIARWWMPDDVAFVDSIPHTATGKISKLQLRAQFKDYSPPRAKL